MSEDENLDDADRLDPNDADIELGDDEFDPDDVHFQPDDFNFVPDFFNFDPDVLPNDHLTGNVLEPTEHDVLLGRGGNIYGRPGNTWYRQDLLPRFKELYDSERRENKRQIAIDAINAVTSSGRRFLKRNELEGWVMAPDAKIIDKVMGDLRKLR